MSAQSKALSTIRQNDLLSQGSTVVVGVSGGADSVALLHILLSLKEELSFETVVAVHVNHGLRGEESERDSHFVADLCQQWNVPLRTFCVDVTAFAKEQKIGLEEAGRILRYRLFEDVCSSFQNAVIATAHTASDNAETVLLHLCRGSSIRGASGIPVKRDKVIRPLINCTRKDVEEYCVLHHLPYVTDSTNLDATFSRNRVRLQVIPAMKEINPKAEEALCRFSDQAQELFEFIDDLSQKAEREAFLSPNCYSREKLLLLPQTLLFFTLQRLFGQCEEKHLRLAQSALKNGGAVTLGENKRFVVSQNTASIVSDNEKVLPFSHTVIFDESYVIGDFAYRIHQYSKKEYEQKLKNDKNIFKNAFDYDKINGTLIFRQRLEGDMFHPVGRGCGKTLKKLFNEYKVTQRDSLPILCDEAGIVAVFGFGADERVKISNNTTYVCVLEKVEEV